MSTAAARATRDGTGWRPTSLASYTMTLHSDSLHRVLRVRAVNTGVQVGGGLDVQGHLGVGAVEGDFDLADAPLRLHGEPCCSDHLVVGHAAAFTIV